MQRTTLWDACHCHGPEYARRPDSQTHSEHTSKSMGTPFQISPGTLIACPYNDTIGLHTWLWLCLLGWISALCCNSSPPGWIPTTDIAACPLLSFWFCLCPMDKLWPHIISLSPALALGLTLSPYWSSSMDPSCGLPPHYVKGNWWTLLLTQLCLLISRPKGQHWRHLPTQLPRPEGAACPGCTFTDISRPEYMKPGLHTFLDSREDPFRSHNKWPFLFLFLSNVFIAFQNPAAPGLFPHFLLHCSAFYV